MKKFVEFVAISLMGFTVTAQTSCIDPNFSNLGRAETYNQLQYLKRFTLLFESYSPAPAGFSEVFGEGSELCHEVKATYLRHNASRREYVMFTTHRDYCDGGNTIGIIVDLEYYRGRELQEAIVADISDSWISCRKK